MNFLRGAEYERRAENRALHQTQTGMGFLQPRIVMGPRAGMQPVFSSVLARARANAGREQRTLPELTEQNNFLNADVIIADIGDPGTRNAGAHPWPMPSSRPPLPPTGTTSRGRQTGPGPWPKP